MGNPHTPRLWNNIRAPEPWPRVLRFVDLVFGHQLVSDSIIVNITDRPQSGEVHSIWYVYGGGQLILLLTIFSELTFIYFEGTILHLLFMLTI